MKKIKKRITEAFGKKIYLLGIDTNGINTWMEAPTWDCDWYWSVGYIEQYTNNQNPELARDLSSHSHWNTAIVGKQEYYDHDKQCRRLSSGSVSHLNESTEFIATTLTDTESWELADLMQSTYLLKRVAEFYGKGQGNLGETATSGQLKNSGAVRKINEVDLPLIFKRVDQILTPSEGGKGRIMKKEKIQVRIARDPGSPGHVIGNIDRTLKAESIGNFNPVFCTYHGEKHLVRSLHGDLSDPFRRDESYLKTLYIEL